MKGLTCNLRHQLEVRGLTQQRLAERAGVLQCTISDAMNEKHHPSLFMAIKIAKALDLQVEDIWEVEQ